ncbi:phosphopantetheine-binding protein [Nonomuraea sp. NN258]|uniref:phosphopantetheine-binding protein n=1 Tax=Nonomuraea antri TaxID=2730852 RepID=UPI001569D574|nr:phosphopantetheine-binding protein [Nonomuraea antri]NRQ34236.1 phosphopantetheine-binding protein [Nonomuraea antri]
MQTTANASALRETVAALIGAAPEDIAGDANLVYLGVGSLEMMRLVTRYRRQGVTLDFAVLAAEPTLDAWERHLREAVR